MALPTKVKMFEVGPRDGIQNEPNRVPTAVKVEFINRLSETGLQQIEIGAFVSPKVIPQMADSREVVAQIRKAPSVTYSTLVPNMKGFDQALEAGVEEIEIFGAVSEAFSQKNINCSIAESLDRFAPVCEAAKKHGIRVRAAVSCVLGCPYEGEIAPEKVAEVTEILYEMGSYEVALGDTIGTGTPEKTKRMLEAITKRVPVTKLSAHFHDTYGQALANIYAALEEGVAVVDSSVAGLGGCPYAKGATGNVASEDVLYMLNGMGIETGVDFDRLVDVGHFISEALGREVGSRAGLATLRKRA
ncbi:MAG: hydroxymethylglutaryl-CoA lyase [Alphaproteobacteria bacterium]|nr:hydroxymethylglutaryl-CoA lyase [Alphaproteobacteria bacterium]